MVVKMYSSAAFPNNEALGSSSSSSSNINNSGSSINGISSIISIVVHQTQMFRKASLYIAKSGCEDVYFTCFPKL
jgi:hypothetical protein